MEYKTSFTHELKIPIDIASAGKMVRAVSLEVKAPTNQVMSDVNIIDFEFSKARKNAMKDSSASIKELTPEQIETFQRVSKEQVKTEEPNPLDVVKEMVMFGADMDRCMFALQNILTAGNKEKPMCIIDVEKMTKPVFQELSIVDTKTILGLYVISFLDTSRSM